MPEQHDTIETWAIVELMGHQKMAGFVSTISLGGAAMLRISVPECDGSKAYDRIVNPAAIYAINPCDEETARLASGKCRTRPIETWELPRQMLPATVEDGRPELFGHDTEADDRED